MPIEPGGVVADYAPFYYAPRSPMLYAIHMGRVPEYTHGLGRAHLPGLADLVRVVKERGIRSVAIPPLGCGNGGLRWSDVEIVVRGAFADLPDVDVLVFPRRVRQRRLRWPQARNVRI